MSKSQGNPPSKPSAASATSVVNVQRRHWDLSSFEEKAQERLKLEDFLPSAEHPVVTGIPENAQAISAKEAHQIIQKRVGSTTIISSAPSSSTPAALGVEPPSGAPAGFYCEICQCTMKDNLAFYDHLNGRSHLKRLGFSVKTQKATLEEVLDRLEYHRQRKWLEKATEEEKRQWEKENQEKIARAAALSLSSKQSNIPKHPQYPSLHYYIYPDLLPFPDPGVEKFSLPPGLKFSIEIEKQLEEERLERIRVNMGNDQEEEATGYGENRPLLVKVEPVDEGRQLMEIMGFSAFQGKSAEK